MYKNKIMVKKMQLYQNGDKNHYLTKTVKNTKWSFKMCFKNTITLYNCKNLLESKIEVL